MITKRPDRLIAKTAVPLARLVGTVVELTPDLHALRGCCPHHPDPSASFYVSESAGFFHCFGCGRSGDAVDWIMSFKGFDEEDAIAELLRSGSGTPA